MELIGVVADGGFQTYMFELRGMKSVGKVVDVVGKLARRFLDGMKTGQQGRLGTAHLFERAHVHRQGCEPLGQIVVEFARNPLPLLILCPEQFC